MGQINKPLRYEMANIVSNVSDAVRTLQSGAPSFLALEREKNRTYDDVDIAGVVLRGQQDVCATSAIGRYRTVKPA